MRSRRDYFANARRRHASPDSSKQVSEHKLELGTALTQLVAAWKKSAWMAFNPETVTS